MAGARAWPCTCAQVDHGWGGAPGVETTWECHFLFKVIAGQSVLCDPEVSVSAPHCEYYCPCGVMVLE